jgi:hypothetical protein
VSQTFIHASGARRKLEIAAQQWEVKKVFASLKREAQTLYGLAERVQS